MVNPRIVGGDNAFIDDIPFQISMTNFGSHRCGGSIYMPNIIVTAAHCVDNTWVENTGIRTGSSFRDRGGIRIPTLDQLMHPYYDPNTINFDIAILKLQFPIPFGIGSQPIALASPDYDVPEGSIAQISGWGWLEEGSWNYPENLQVVRVPVVSNERCNEMHYGINEITDVMICAGHPDGGLDACQEDSGGPMVVNNILVGVVSWGVGCAQPAFPGVYARVSELRTWIDAVSI